MSTGDIVSILINLAVGTYFAVIYPRSVRKRFTAQTAPRAFTLLLRVVPVVGYMIIGMTIVYAVALLTGMGPVEQPAG